MIPVPVGRKRLYRREAERKASKMDMFGTVVVFLASVYLVSHLLVAYMMDRLP